MKRIFAILMTICLLAGALSITAFAAEAPAEGVVIRVSAKDKKTSKDVVIKDYTEFDEGWEGAIDFALSEEEMEKYSRVIVDFYGDWTANEDGEFGDSWRFGSNWGDGFQYSTIYIPDDVRITLNLNGHTINRDLKESELDGEVIYIDEDADVIINNGTITGGKSTNGAGGIHIHGADVELNDVHIVGNVADNDDGGGIALYDGAQLIMTRGSFRDNTTDGIEGSGIGDWECMGAAIYIDDSKAIFSNVEFKNNQNTTDSDYGAAIYVNDGVAYIDKCTFDGNGIKDDAKGYKPSLSIIHAEDSTVKVENSTFTNNGYNYHNLQHSPMGGAPTGYESAMFTLESSTLKVLNGCKFTNNATFQMFELQNGTSSIYVSDATFTDNGSSIISAGRSLAEDSYFRNCTFNNNLMTKPEMFHQFNQDYTALSFYAEDCTLTLEGCDMGNSTYDGLEYIKFVDCKNAPNARRFGSIFGEGSLTMIVALLALIASGVAIFLTVYYNKKKAAPVAVDTKEAEDEE